MRIGLNVGEVLGHDDEPFGAAVNAGARVMAKADGGEILVSEMVRSLAGTVPGIEYRDRGRHAFKGFDEPWRLYQLVWAGAPRPRPKPRRRPSRRLVLAAAAGAVGVAAVAGGVILATRDGNSGLRRLDRNSVGLLDAKSGRILQEVRVGSDPRTMAARKGLVWVGNYGDNTVTRVVEKTGETKTIPVHGHPIAIAPIEGGAWVLELEHQLERVDSRFDRVTMRVATDASRLTVGAGSLWTTTGRTYVRRLSQRDGRPVGDPIVPDLGANDLAVARDTVWACGAALTPIDIGTSVQGQAVILGGCRFVAAAGGAVWCFVSGLDGTRVVKVGAAGGGVLGSTKVSVNAAGIAAGAGAAWLPDPSAGSVTRVSGSDLRGVRTIMVGAAPTAVAVGRRGVWVAAS